MCRGGSGIGALTEVSGYALEESKVRTVGGKLKVERAIAQLAR